MSEIIEHELSEDERLMSNLCWESTPDYEKEVFLNACFILDVPPPENTLAREAYDRMVTHTRATLAMSALSAALDFDQKTRARVTAQLERLRADIEQTNEAWERASAYADVLIGDRA